MNNKQAEAILAYNRGEVVQALHEGEWLTFGTAERPTWNLEREYRVKPIDNPYKQDAEQWGNALNEAAWAFTEACPVKSTLLFNTCKPALREAIRVYLEAVERDKK